MSWRSSSRAVLTMRDLPNDRHACGAKRKLPPFSFLLCFIYLGVKHQPGKAHVPTSTGTFTFFLLVSFPLAFNLSRLIESTDVKIWPQGELKVPLAHLRIISHLKMNSRVLL